MRFLAIFALAFCILVTQASASIITYTDTMIGANVVPPNGSPATASATITLDTVTNLLDVSINFAGLSGPAVMSHIHCCAAAGVNGPVAITFVGFPVATSGTYTDSFDLTLDATYSASFLTAHGGTAASAEADLLAAMDGGMAYTMIHTQNFPGGEIRGQLAPVDSSVPEPATVALCGAGLLLLGALRRRR